MAANYRSNHPASRSPGAGPPTSSRRDRGRIAGRRMYLWHAVDHQGEVLCKTEIMAAVWPKAVVEEGSLTLQISALRRILDRITSARLGADPLDQSVETFTYLIHFGIVGKCSLQFGELRGRGQPLLCQGLRHPGPPLVVDPIAH